MQCDYMSVCVYIYIYIYTERELQQNVLNASKHEHKHMIPPSVVPIETEWRQRPEYFVYSLTIFNVFNPCSLVLYVHNMFYSTVSYMILLVFNMSE